MGNDEKKAQQELDNKREEMDQKTEEMKGKLSLAGDLAKQTYHFGLYLNILATWHGSLALPWGLAAAGAAMTRTFVDSGDVKGAIPCDKGTSVMFLGLRRHLPRVRSFNRSRTSEPTRLHIAGTAKATALMVKLGLLNLVRDIVANLSQQDRSDVVSQVILLLLLHSFYRLEN